MYFYDKPSFALSCAPVRRMHMAPTGAARTPTRRFDAANDANGIVGVFRPGLHAGTTVHILPVPRILSLYLLVSFGTKV